MIYDFELDQYLAGGYTLKEKPEEEVPDFAQEFVHHKRKVKVLKPEEPDMTEDELVAALDLVTLGDKEWKSKLKFIGKKLGVKVSSTFNIKNQKKKILDDYRKRSSK